MASRAPSRPAPSRKDEIVAGVDLGSNSFHLVVARAEEDGRVHILDRLRDPVRLAAGLNDAREIGPESVRRALSALERFGERLRGMPRSAVRAVGTNTLRQARNGAEVEQLFSDALGHPVEIISGREEARLIYVGVTHAIPSTSGNQLVLDIGGGSTECVIGRGYEPLLLDSLYMGCVAYTSRFFGEGRLSHEAFQQARLAAGLELSSIGQRYRETGWERAIGSSGTILAVREVLRAKGWGDELITQPALEKLEEAIVARGRIADLSLPGLEVDRAAVFAGGVAILSAAFQLLKLESLGTSSGALREGLVHELLGRVTEGDPRDRTIETLALRYKVDRAQARRVARTAERLFEQANESWGYDAELGRRYLRWAARVHEIGLSIAYSGHQKHGAYLLAHGDMPGFSLDEQATLAAIVGAHRRKLSRSLFEGLADRRKLAFHLTLLLRLAVRLHHSRSDAPLPPLELRAKKSRLRLAFPPGWLDVRPLTQGDLQEEAAFLAKAGVTLELASAGAEA